ncbi:MAG: tetrathionate reductase family octaheme c-type cytochrome [Calditrichaeota bacterium]|nr:MAG: tetrathionate reductase family octaheme c-type cytochrome [Calditrichota bacterium]MBL1207365.1 tetrathionate reductase family octaheme c-type cytochrome [Calditrichota bacterium]NOG47197.1 tetrathionate reductase family octaheme c-type cytochrome [Calditrichota bacterium]
MTTRIFMVLLFITYSFAQIEEHQGEMAGPFNSPQEVTEACLSCHEDAAKQIMSTTHWTWLSADSMLVPGHDQKMRVGKKNVFNNFCIALNSNWPRCTSCHVGYGWKDTLFDFKNEQNVDCIVCHDNTGKYVKAPTKAGYPAENVDLVNVAQNVGMPTRQSCGTCHFYGGGGENVKHGDLESALVNPPANFDIHMGENEMLCQDCHETESHGIKGVSLAVNTKLVDKEVECTDCHDIPVHNNADLDKHSEKIACQTCHIPTYAKEKPRKVYWDWSDAGKKMEVPKDKYGQLAFHKKKGSFVWEKDIRPEYLWYNGNTERYLLGDKINENGITRLNYPLGNKDEEKSKIYPFKVHRGKQLSDAQNKYLLIPKLFGGYWKHFDWSKAAEDGMKGTGFAYSGKYEFVETEMYWRVNHEVISGENALSCLSCHGDNGRMDWEALGYKNNPASEDDIAKMKK